MFALLIRFQTFWNRKEDAVCRKCQKTLSGGKECHQGRKMWKWFMESCLDIGLFGAETMLYPQWYSYLTRLRAESTPSPPLASSLPAPHTVLAPPLYTGTQIQGLIILRSKLKTKKGIFSSPDERTIPRGSCSPPGTAGTDEGRCRWVEVHGEAVQLSAQGYVPPEPARDTSVAEKWVPQQVSAC